MTSCTSEKASIDDQLEKYLTYWTDEQFAEMYDMLTDETKQQYSTDEFVDRYTKIYQDIKMKNLTISYTELDKSDIKQANKDEHIQIPITVALDSIAGEIKFTEDIKLQRIKEDNQFNWKVNWTPSLIFPELADGGQVQVQTINPKRGEILDRNRMPLAINDNVYEVGVIPEKFVDKESEIKDIASLLGISTSAIEKILDAEWVEPHLFVPIRKISNTKSHILTDLRKIPAVTHREVIGRAYPSGKAAAHLTGYIGQITNEEYEKVNQSKYTPNDEIGKRGLEQLFENELKGERGYKISIQHDEDQIVLAEKAVKHGENITVTIDINAQEAIFGAYGDYAGTAAAIHPKTGEVLALVSSPAFDPNDLLYGITETQWDQLQNDPYHPLVNRFSSTFAPGSVIKPVTAAIGLTNGTLKPDDQLTINGLAWGKKNWGGYKVRRVSDSGHPVNLKDALTRSDNIYFAMQAVDMGDKAFIKGLESFGFTEEIPFKFPLSSSPISNEGHLKDEVLLANTSYGQGEIEVTPLHMALSYTPFLNDGNLIKPTLLLDEKNKQIWHKNVMSKEHATLVNDILRNVVTNGTAKVANVNNLKISGKTGTAELKLSSESRGHENGWFVGYPTESEDILIAMMIERVEHSGASSFVAKKVTDILVELKK